mgnify:CR=1 FL=1
MGRVSLVIHKTELSQAVQTVEEANNGPFANRSQLAEAVANTDWAQNVKDAKDRVKGASAAVIAQRIKELGIEPQTPVGKRGRQPGSISPNQVGKKKTRAEKFSVSEYQKPFDTLIKSAPDDRWKKVAQRAKKGSMAAAVKLKCAECVGYENVSNNVRNCHVFTCPLWAFRPYQNVTVEREETTNNVEETEKVEVEVA